LLAGIIWESRKIVNLVENMQKLFEESLEEVHKGWLENKWKIERIYEQGFIGGCAEYF
jgi:hypothetical protein